MDHNQWLLGTNTLTAVATDTHGFNTIWTPVNVLLVMPAAVSITPASQAVCRGGTANFTATPLGSGPFGYVWTENGGLLSGQTNNVLTITNATPASAGTYTVVVTGPYNNATNSAFLTVLTNTTARDREIKAVVLDQR